MILLIDNYDSFSHNLYQLVGSLNPDIQVVRNDAMTAGEIAARKPEAIVLSPGPGRPEDAGVCMDVIHALGGSVPMLGVCLGHQAICAAYGATVSYAKELMHGKQSSAALAADCPLFCGCAGTILVARYHSLAAVEETIPKCLRVTARTLDGEVMAVMHAEHPVFGLQFHPESILTPNGKTIVENFLTFSKKRKQSSK